MPLPPPIDNALKVELIYTNAGLDAVNVLWFEAAPALNQAGLDALLEAVAEAWIDAMLPLLYSTVTLTEVRGTLYDGVTSTLQGQFLPTGATGGVSSDDPAPPQVAVVISWRTALGGRQNRGRSYLMGIPNNIIQDDGRLTEIARSAFQANAAAFIAAIADEPGGTFVVFSRSTYDPPRPGTSDPTPPRIGHFTEITTALVDARVDTQRRRLDN